VGGYYIIDGFAAKSRRMLWAAANCPHAALTFPASILFLSSCLSFPVLWLPSSPLYLLFLMSLRFPFLSSSRQRSVTTLRSLGQVRSMAAHQTSSFSFSCPGGTPPFQLLISPVSTSDAHPDIFQLIIKLLPGICIAEEHINTRFSL
jgi:hypothetical protein